MKTKFKLISLVLLLVVLVLGISLLSAGAAPLATRYGAQPLYDSGWVATPSNGFQTFNHNLDAYPTLISIYVADNVYGSHPSVAFDNRENGGSYYGGSVRDTDCNTFLVYWQPSGIAYNHYLNKWYQRGVDYSRVLVFAADTEFGCGGPCRPCRP